MDSLIQPETQTLGPAFSDQKQCKEIAGSVITKKCSVPIFAIHLYWFSFRNMAGENSLPAASERVFHLRADLPSQVPSLVRASLRPVHNVQLRLRFLYHN